MAGSKVEIWKQDSRVDGIGIRSRKISTRASDWPSDQDMVLQGMPHVEANAAMILYSSRWKRIYYLIYSCQSTGNSEMHTTSRPQDQMQLLWLK